MNKLPDINKDFPRWYQEVVFQADLSENGPVKGSMVIKPYGWSIWENIKNYLDQRIKITGHSNMSFPLLIPESFLTKEADHVEGFAPELAIVTHAGGKKLEEPLVVRPTSETMVYYMFSRWIKSWRDLPIKINQWANVVRWEMRPRAFIRSTEFFWQEGHTAHSTKEEADLEAKTMLAEYVKMTEDLLAIPVITGEKSASEKFAGADKTLTFEAIMPDGKAIQMGTSHLLSQSFAKAFNVKFQNKTGLEEHPYFTSWGVTTRLVGALIMAHGDSKGLVLPPKIAPIQVVIVPILRGSSEEQQKLKQELENIFDSLKVLGIRVKIDDDDQKSPGAKFYKWELKGVPLRIEFGPKDLEKNQVVITDRLDSKKEFIKISELNNFVLDKLSSIQKDLYSRAEEKLKNNLARTSDAEKLSKFGEKLSKDGGAYQAGWCQDDKCELELKKYKASIRCIVEHNTQKKCFNCDRSSISDVIVAKSY